MGQTDRSSGTAGTSTITRRVPVIMGTIMVAVFSAAVLAGSGSRGAAEPPAGSSPPGQPAPRARTEEEDRDQPKKRQVPKVDDDPAEPARPAPKAAPPKPAAARGKAVMLRPAQLVKEAEEAAAQEIKSFYKELSTPYDLLYLTNVTHKVEPVAERVTSSMSLTDPVAFRTMNAAGTVQSTLAVPRADVTRVEPYERLVIARVDDLLGMAVRDTAQRERVTLARLLAAETVLGAALQFHDEARAENHRRGAGWDEVRTQVFERRRAVQIQRLRQLQTVESWEEAEGLANQILDEHRDNVEAVGAVARFRGRFVESALKEGDLAAARRGVEQLERDFPKNPEVDRFVRLLSGKAQEFLTRALRAEAVDRGQALEWLAAGLDVWPRLDGLREKRREIMTAYPILTVSVPALPELMSPALADTPTERQTLDLLFDRLVVPWYEGTGETRFATYRLGLASRWPAHLPLGREFDLVRDAAWSDGKQLTAADVSGTVKLLKRPGWPGRPAEWDELIDGAEVGTDPFRVRLVLRQGYVDPLGLMTFPVLPAARLQDAGDVGFARQPVGSGPFRLDRRVADPDLGVRLIFKPNPHYRGGKVPVNLREIRMMVSTNPAADFRSERVQMLLGVTARERDRLPPGTVHQVTNRRVYFLAVNHRQPVLQNLPLRRALGNGIDRAKLLAECFAGDDHSGHHPLTGPFPHGSWASAEDVPPYNTELARRFAGQGLKAVGRDLTLTLKFPAGDPAVEKACRHMARHLSALAPGKLTIQAEARPPADFRTEVRTTHDYELAYCSWDYANDALWLWPLFDPTPAARAGDGSNYLGYQNDAALESCFQRLLSHRQVAALRKDAREVHRRVNEQMPLIPLWQLDTYVAVQPSVQYGNGRSVSFTDRDVSHLFADAQGWSVAPR